MTDVIFGHIPNRIPFSAVTRRTIWLAALTLVVVVIAVALAYTFNNLGVDDPLLTDSTVGELGLWMANQSEEDSPVSFLGQYAKGWAERIGEESLPEDVILTTMRNNLVFASVLIAALALFGAVALLMNFRGSRTVLLFVLVGLDTWLLIVPVIEGDSTLPLILISITLMCVVLLFAPGRVTRVLGFMVVLSVLMMVWEVSKSFAGAIDYRVTMSQRDWEYTTYPTLDEALAALEQGDVTAIIADRKDLADLMAPHPLPADEQIDPGMLPYPTLRYLDNIIRGEHILGRPISPAFPRRLSVAVRVDDVGNWTASSQFLDEQIATVAEEFADERYLSAPREWVIINLKILTDINLPHLQNIAEALLQPARRNGPVLLLRILFEAAIYTASEALFGFLFGAMLGFLLGTLFTHSQLMERGLLPYVVASQTVPILAIAPMVVIWLGAGLWAVAVIAAYLTFFPVTINTMRGLQSPDPTALELMHSYAASRWAIMWKLRFPAALPYIFTALKVSATASVVGAIIGELPSSIRNGLGRAILDFASNYSLISTPKLWGTIFVAAMVGIIFFLAVSLLERLVLRGQAQNN